ncbi:MAG: hypothetical protein WD069_13990 [Planctomycetales bacterium]
MGPFPKSFLFVFGTVLIAIGAFLTLFYGVWIKRREVGAGLDTPEKRIALYVAIGIGAAFIGGGVIFLVLMY